MKNAQLWGKELGACALGALASGGTADATNDTLG